MPVVSPQFVYWSGVIVGCGVYLFLICRIVDGIWDIGLTGTVHEIVWGFALRRILRWLAGFYAVVLAGMTVLSACFVFSEPWKSLGTVTLFLPITRIMIWLFWRLSDDYSTTKWVMDSEAKQRGIERKERALMWFFHWGEYQGLMPEIYKRSSRKKAGEAL